MNNAHNIRRIQELILKMGTHPFLEPALARTLGVTEAAQLFALLDRVQRNLCPFAQEGYQAGLEGAERKDCPYQEGTDGQNGWTRGLEESAKKSC
jgi:ribosome modulation factor